MATEDAPIEEDGMQQIVDHKSDLEQALEKNQTPIIAGVCVALIGSAGYFSIKELSKSKRAAANLAFTQASTIEDYNLVIQDHGGSVAAGNAYLAKAQLMIDEDKSDEAHQVLRKFIEQYEKHPRYVQGVVALASLTEESGKNDDARAHYQNIVDNHGDSELAPYAQLRIGDLLLAEGKEDEARKVFQQIASTYPRTGQTWLIKVDQRLERLGDSREVDVEADENASSGSEETGSSSEEENKEEVSAEASAEPSKAEEAAPAPEGDEAAAGTEAAEKE